LASPSRRAFNNASKQISVATEHLGYLAGNGHGKNPNDRKANDGHWKTEIKAALKNAKRYAKRCTKKAKEKVLEEVKRLEKQLKKFDD